MATSEFEPPLEYLDSQIPASRPSITTTMVLQGGTHNAFSTMLGPEPVEVCKPADVLAADEQRRQIAAFLPGFFDLALEHVGASR